jgi:hypothetical protein
MAAAAEGLTGLSPGTPHPLALQAGQQPLLTTYVLASWAGFSNVNVAATHGGFSPSSATSVHSCGGGSGNACGPMGLAPGTPGLHSHVGRTGGCSTPTSAIGMMAFPDSLQMLGSFAAPPTPGVMQMCTSTVDKTEGASFKCACCAKALPLGLGLPKGNQMWCLKDNASYNALVARWKIDARLKAWWQRQSPDQRIHWFIRWQNLSGKRRFDDIRYEEVSEGASEVLGDRIVRHIGFVEFQ